MVPALALTFIGVGTASAHGPGMGFKGFGFGASKATAEQIAEVQTNRFQEVATLLGISVQEVKQAWAEGKTIQQLATAHGITAEQLKQKMIDARAQQMKGHLKILVDKGVITQAQADQRLAVMQNMKTKKQVRGFGHMHGFGF